MSAQHSPLPWKADGADVLSGGSLTCRILDYNRRVIASDIGRDEAEGNAAFIARACNNHEELLAALRVMTTRFERCARHAGSDAEFVAVSTSDAHALIAKAEV